MAKRRSIPTFSYRNTARLWQLAFLLSLFIWTSALVPCKNGGELSNDGQTCLCFDGFTGSDCNELVDFCKNEDTYNEKCATNACVPTNNAFYCTSCKDSGKTGIHCVRDANDSTATAEAPYFVFLPKVGLFEELPVLFSLRELGDDLTLKVLWGDGVEDIRQGKDFHRGFLRDEVPSIGLDALAPGTPAFKALPPERRYIVRFSHSFNRWLSAKGPVKNWFILENQPPNSIGKEMQHQFALKVVFPEAGTLHGQDHSVKLSMPEVGGIFASNHMMPHWSRRDSILVLGEAEDSVTMGSADQYIFTYSLIVRIGTAEQVNRPHVVSPDKRFHAAPFSVPIGKHGLKYCAWNGTRLVDFIMGYFLVVPSPLQLVMLGGSARTVSPRQALVLDASASIDLNEVDLRRVSFTWTCVPEDDEDGDGGGCPFRTATGPRWIVMSHTLSDGQRFTVVLEAAREFLETLVVRQAVTVDADLAFNVDIICERNCGSGLGVLSTERVSLRARCSTSCPKLSWSLSPASGSGDTQGSGEANLPLGSQGRRFVIAPPSLAEHSKYYVNLSVPVGDAWVEVSSLSLSMTPKPDHSCSSRGYGVRTTIKCHDVSDPSSRWTTYTLYKFFQRSSKGGRVLVGYTFTGIGVALVFLNAPVEVVATMPWGAEWSTNLTVAGGRPSSLNLSTTLSKAEARYHMGNEMVATVMVASALTVILERGETPDQKDLSAAAALCNQYMGSTPHAALWWQYAELTLILGELGIRGAGTFMDDLSEHLGAMLVAVSDQLVQLAKNREPPAISSEDVEDRFRKITRVVTYMTVDANSDMAKQIRNLSVSEDELEPDYLLYTDLMPGHMERERKFRAGARAAIKTLYNIIRAEQWRLLPGLPPVQMDVDSSGTAAGLGRITVWSQVETIAGLAERPNATLPENCDFHVDAERGRELDLRADAFALTVAFIRGSLTWFEPVPTDIYSNTPTSALVDLQVFDDGPAGPAPPVAEVIGVTLPAPSAVAADEARVQGQLRALTRDAEWTDHVLVYHLHAYDGTGAVQLEMVVVLQEKWPKSKDFYSPRAVVVSQTQDVVIGVAVRNRLNSFVHLGLAFANATLEKAAARGQAEVTYDFSFTPLNLACKSWSDSRYRWVTGEHRELWQLSGPRALTCALHHLSLFSGLVLLPPHFVHPLRDAALFATLYRNWLVFVYVMVTLFIWLVWLPFAIRQDRVDREEWRVVVLDDISPEAQYPYLVSVFSGNLAQGQTTAYVGIRICGDKQDSGPHMLSHERRALSRTYDDWFLLYTPGPLGELLSLELWTDCAGMRPYWYCEKVLVEELQTGRVWTFPAYCWLSLEHGTRRACVTLPPAPLLWKHRFNSLIKATARGDHTWLSVLFRHPRMTFSRAQRLSVAFSEHFLDMVVSIMFFNVAEEVESNLTTVPEMLWHGFMIGLESSLITMPVALLINWIFQVEEVEATPPAGEQKSSAPLDHWPSPGRASVAPYAVASMASARAAEAGVAGAVSAGALAVASATASPAAAASLLQAVGEWLQPGPAQYEYVLAQPGAPAPGPAAGEVGARPRPRAVRPGLGRSNVQGPSQPTLITPIALGETTEGGLPVSRIPLESSIRMTTERCSGYRKLRIRTVPRSSGMPTVVVYLGGWVDPNESEEQDENQAKLRPPANRSAVMEAPTPSVSVSVRADPSTSSAPAEVGADASTLTLPMEPPLRGASEAAARAATGTAEVPRPLAVLEVQTVEASTTGEQREKAVGGAVSVVSELRLGDKKPEKKRDEKEQKKKKEMQIIRTSRRKKPDGGEKDKKTTKEKTEWDFRQRRTWRIATGWVLCSVTIVTSGYFTILYGLKYGWQQSWQWFMASMSSLILGIFIIQPIKMILVAYIFARYLQKDTPLEQKSAPFSRPVTLPPLVPPRYRSPGTNAKMYRKLTRTEAEVLLVLRRHRQQLQKRAIDTLLWVLWIVFMYACVTAASDTLYFFMQRHVSSMVLYATHTRTRQFGQFYDVYSYREFYEYLNRTVAGTLLRRKAAFNETPDVLQPYVAFAADNVTRMIGVVRIRQQRVQEEPSCLAAEPFRWTGTPCYTDYYKMYSDRADYGEGWNTSQAAVNVSAEDLSLGKHSLSIWRFRTAWDLDSLFSIGQDTQFLGGGYVVDLGRVNLNAEIELRYMSRHGWLDRRTRGVFIEFILYSPSTNIFCDVFLFLERTPASYFHFSSKLYAYRLGYAAGKWNSAHIAFLVVLIAVSFVMLVREVVSMYRLGRHNYPFNWFDGILVGVITLNGALYFGTNHFLKTVLERMNHLDPKFFISFQFTTFLNSSMQFGLGVLVVLSTVRCWRVLSFATHFQVVKTMLRLAYVPLLHLLSYLMLVQLQFAVLFMLIMGGSQENLHCLQHAYVLLLAYLVDYTADYDEFADSARRDTLLSLVSYWVFVGFMYFFFLNFFLGIVSMAFESAGEIVRQQEIEGFSMANLISDELRYLLKLPGGKLRRDSSLFQHTRRNFVQQKNRIHGETIRVARAELGAMSMMYRLLTDKPVSDRELQGAMAMMTLNVTTPMEERVSFPGPPMEVSIGKSWSGEELLDMNKLHTVMQALNARGVDRDMAVDQEHIVVIRRLIKEATGERPPSTLPVIVRVRRGAPFQRRPMFRIADLVIRRRRCVQIRFRLRRITGPTPKPRPPWRP